MVPTEPTTELVRQWIALRDQKDGLEEQVKEIKDLLGMLAEHIKDRFLSEGTSRLTVDGVTVHVTRDVKISAKGGEYDNAVEVLRRVGLESLVREQFNTLTLKSVVKEIMQSADMGDEHARAQLKGLESAFSIFELYSLSARRAATSRAGDRFLAQNNTERENES